MTNTRRLDLVFAVLAGGWILIAYGARHLAIPPSSTDLQAIQKLRRQDIAATLSGDPQALAGPFTADAVLLQPGSTALIGKRPSSPLSGRRRPNVGLHEYSVISLTDRGSSLVSCGIWLTNPDPVR
jgi:hypothetical protein